MLGNKKTILNAMLIGIMLSACTASTDQQTSVNGGGAAGVYVFDGIKKIEANRDGTYNLSWVPIVGLESVRYAVYSRKKTENFDFSSAIATTERSFYVTEDLRLVGNTCYIVRYVSGADSSDDNTKEMCTGHEPFSFEGIESLVALRDQSYMLRWADVGFDGAIFNILERTVESTDWKLIGQTSQNFYKTESLPLDDIRCYKVLHTIEGFPEDNNQAQTCTTSRSDPDAFIGIRKVTSPGTGQVKIEWEPSQLDEVTGYNIYLGTDFSKKAAFAKGREQSDVVISDLLHAVVYTFGVRAVDQYGREDSNEAIISFELQNHLPNIPFVKITPEDGEGNPLIETEENPTRVRPERLRCTVEYTDVDTWQTLTPTFYMKNNKRGSTDLTERAKSTEKPNTKEFIYQVIDTDDRADRMICSLTVHDGFGHSIEVKSEPYPIPDTKVIATGLELTTLENKSVEITITRGENKGYTDEDQDIAESIVIKGITGGSLEGEGFKCNEGSCTALFKPAKDFYSKDESDKSTWANIEYQVETEDNISEPDNILINVRSIPRALGFNLTAEQDRVRTGLCVSAKGIASADPDDPYDNCQSDNDSSYPFYFDGYLHKLNAKADRIYFRHPLAEEYYGGIVGIPANLASDTENRCERIDIDGWIDPGFECVIKCDENGKCPFDFYPWSEDPSVNVKSMNEEKAPSYYGPAKIDYAVEIDGILSSYGSTSIDILPKLRAMPYEALTVQGQEFNLRFTEGIGYQGSSNEIIVQEIKASNFDKIATFEFQKVVEIVNGKERVFYDATIKPLTIPGTSQFISGDASFEFKVVAKDSKGRFFESNLGNAEINFYPKPVATGIKTQGLESTVREISIVPTSNLTNLEGYFHANGDLAQQINLLNINLQRGYVIEAGQDKTEIAYPCDTGSCFVNFDPIAGLYDKNNQNIRSFSYQVVTEIPELYLNPTMSWETYILLDEQPEDVVFIDEFLQNLANRFITSNMADVELKVRPIPQTRKITLYTPENAAKKPSSLIIELSHADDNAFLNGEYFHPLSFIGSQERILAFEASVENDPINGTLTPFSCNQEGRCQATYRPSANQTGQVNPGLKYNVTLNDPEYEFGGYKVSSKWETMDIDVRPIPKATDIRVYMKENAEFLTDPLKNPDGSLPSTMDIVLSKGDITGYTHVSPIYAKSAFISHEFELNGAIFTADSCADVHPKISEEYSGLINISENIKCHALTCETNGDCSIEFTPKENFVGNLEFDYAVAVEDTEMKADLWSTPGKVELEVRPLPRTNDLGSPDNRFIVHEDGERKFQIKPNHQGYHHLYQLPAASIKIASIKEGTGEQPEGSCNASGECEIIFKPLGIYEGESYIDFYVEVFDEKLGALLKSNISRIYIDVYPKPRATSRGLFLLEDSIADLELELAPVGNPPKIDESDIEAEPNSDGIYLKRKGYAHRRDELARSIAVTSSIPPQRGEIGNFTCDSSSINGLCSATYTAKAFEDGVTDSFTYSVTIKDPEGVNLISPDDGTYKISLRPRPKTHKFTVYTTENADFLETPEIATIQIKNEEGKGYTHALNLKAEQITAVLQDINADTEGTQVKDLQCFPETSGSCQFQYEPKPNVYGEIAFNYTVSLFDESLNDQASSLADEGVVTLDIRPLPRNADIGSQNSPIVVHENEFREFTISRENNTYTHPYSYIVPTLVSFEAATYGSNISPKNLNLVQEGDYFSLKPDGDSTNPSPQALGKISADCQNTSCTISFDALNNYEGRISISYKTGSYDNVIDRTLYSDVKTIYIDVYPKPRATSRKAFVLEKSSKNLEIDLREKSELTDPFLYEDASPMENRMGYTHRRNQIAASAEVGSKPTEARATLGQFSCDSEGKCVLPYTAGQALDVSSTDTFQYRVIVKDPDQKDVFSEFGNYQVNVRPRPKTHQFKVYTTENADFTTTPVVKTIEIKNEQGKGYTHALGLKAREISATPQPSAKTQGTQVTGLTCSPDTVTGSCEFKYEPGTNIYGEVLIDYTVTVEDEKIGPAVSEDGQGIVTLDIRPLPRNTDIGSSTDRMIVQENTSKTFTVSRDENTFIHPDVTIIPTEVIIESASNAKNTPVATCENGVCSIIYTPATNYEGPASVKYKVGAYDSAIEQTLYSDTKTIFIDVYPKPRATGRKAFVLENRTSNIEISLRNRADLTDPFLFETNWENKEDRKGYTHRRNQFAYSAELGSVPLAERASLGNFSCQPDGSCFLAYTPGTAKVDGSIDIFQYRVSVKDPDDEIMFSNFENYEIQVRPTPKASDLHVATLENEAKEIDLAFGSGLAHNHLLGLKPQSIEILDAKHGAVTIVDQNTENEALNCSPSGLCRVIFTPESDFYSPDSDLKKAYLVYKVWTYDPILDENVPSNEAKVFVNVRPFPKANNLNFVMIQGQTANIDLIPGNGNDYFYPTGSGFVDSAELIAGSSFHGGATPFGNCKSENGHCSTIFTPGLKGDEPYYGNEAKFSYKLKVFDAALNRNIESNEATVSFDYRPRPKATGKQYTIWQGTSLPIEINPNHGYFHHYYADDPDQFKPHSAAIISPLPTGNFTGGTMFDCSLSPTCTITYESAAGYYSTSSDDMIEIHYRVKISDPVYKDPAQSPLISSAAESYWEKPITVDIKPIVVNTGKFDRGVQGVARKVILDLDDGYTYPAQFNDKNTSLQIEVKNKVNGRFETAGNVDFSCTGSTCEGIWSASNPTITGVTSFDYKIIQTEEGLDSYESEVKTYTVDFYPIPKAISRTAQAKNNGQLGYEGKHFIGEEGQAYKVEILPGTNPSEISLLCDLNSVVPSDPRASYSHQLCAPAISVNVAEGSANNGSFDTTFNCDQAGVCTATFTPLAISQDWPGYGLAKFDFNVTINPPELQNVDLSIDERNALTSNTVTSNIEFFPLPKATGVRISDTSDYTYAIQGNTVAIDIDRCNDTTQDECDKGYVHGYNLDATNIDVTSIDNIIIDTLTQTGATWTLSLRPESEGFYTSDANSLANIKYKVQVGEKLSPNEGDINVNIYPVPSATPAAAFGLEGQDTKIVIKNGAGNGYTHPFDRPAIAVYMASVPQNGVFLDPTNSGAEITADQITTTQDLDKAWTCDNTGECIATFRPAQGFSGNTTFFFKVLVDGPDDMPQLLKDQLQTGQEAYTINIFAKPTVSTREFVVIEEVQTAIDLDNSKGYNHPINGAKYLTFVGEGDFPGRKLTNTQITVNDNSNRGILSSSNFNCPLGDNGLNCTRICEGGKCSMQFTSAPDIFSKTTAETNGCSDAAAECPEIAFKATVESDTGLIAESENYATLRFNVRRKPRISEVPPSYVMLEGESLTLTLANNQGYDHPLLPASSIDVINTTHKDSSAPLIFTCAENEDKTHDCTATFTPDPGFKPAFGNHEATVEYKVKVDDPTFRTDTNVPVGELTSDNSGVIKINYRSRPVAQDTARVVAQDAPFDFIVKPNQGYTYSFIEERKASKLYIDKSTMTKIDFQNPETITCDGDLCHISCAASECVLPLKAKDGEFAQGSFKFKVAVEDDNFTPKRELLSNDFATASIDIRPRPVAKDVTVYTLENNSVEITLNNPTFYEHPYDASGSYIATRIDIVTGSIKKGTIGAQFGSCNAQGECTDTFTPSLNSYGYGEFEYIVYTLDPVLNEEIPSYKKKVSIDIRPLPDATGLKSIGTIETSKTAHFALFQSQSLPDALIIKMGEISDKLGYFYPHGDADAATMGYDTHPKTIKVVNVVPNTKLHPLAFSCSSTGDIRACDSDISAQNTYGAATLMYKVEIEDPKLVAAKTNNIWNQSTSVFSNEDSIYIDVRPIPITENINSAAVAGNAATYTNLNFRAIEDTPLTWRIENGTDLGYTYPSNDALRGDDYTATLNNGLAIDTSNNLNGIVSGTSCSNGVCTGTFTPAPGATNEASFDFKLQLTDPLVTANGGLPFISSTYKTAKIDIYPRPVASQSIIFHTIQDKDVTIKIQKGNGLGYEHAREDNPVAINAVATTKGAVGAASCSGDSCELTFTPETSFYSSSPTATGEARLDYKVSVSETIANPRVAESSNTGKAEILIYPKPVADASGIQNTPIWEGEPVTITLKPSTNGNGQGYEHAWGDKAKSINIISITDGSQFDVDGNACTSGTLCMSCDNAGICTGTFLPKLGADESDFGIGQISITYEVTTEFTSALIGNTQVTSGQEELKLNLRPVPKVPNTPIVLTQFKENTSFEELLISGVKIEKGNGYSYPASSGAIALEMRNLTNATCAACAQEAACTNGICNVPDITPSLDFNRNDGAVEFEYRVKTKDSITEAEKWSNWGKFQFPLIPRPRGQNLTFNDGTERNSDGGQEYEVEVSLDAGYSHDENAMASILVIDPADMINMDDVVAKTASTVSCEGNADPLCNVCPAGLKCFKCSDEGVCSIGLKPQDTSKNYDQVGNYPDPKGQGYGWSRMSFQVNTPVTHGPNDTTVDFLSVPGQVDLYIHPLPKVPEETVFELTATPVPQKNNAIEDQEKTIVIGLGSGYTHVLDYKASKIDLSNIQEGLTVNGSPTCDASGNCSINLFAADPGEYTFDYEVTVTNPEGTIQLLQKQPAEGSITFVDRAQTSNVTQIEIIEGQSYRKDFIHGAEFTQANQNKMHDILVVTQPNTTSVKVYSNNNNSSACASFNETSLSCLCLQGYNKCGLEFESAKKDDWPGEFESYEETLSFKTRDSIFEETDGSPLLSENESTLSLRIKARVRATGKDYTAEQVEGVEGLEKKIILTRGDGYEHELGENAASLTITGKNSLDADTNHICWNGKCTITVAPLTGENFNPNASFTYRIKDRLLDGYSSHVDGTVNVTFYPKPKMTTNRITVKQNSKDNILTISRGAGYTHLTDGNLTGWDEESGSPKYNGSTFGSLSDWACNINGVCTVEYDAPNGNDKYTGSVDDVASFTYEGWIERNHSGDQDITDKVESSAPGTFYIEVFPVPSANSKKIYWVEGIGDRSKTTDQNKITITKNTDFTSPRGDDPTGIIISDSNNGTVGTWACADDTCSAIYNPSRVSNAIDEVASSFNYQVVTAEKEDFPSDKAAIEFIVMPKAQTYERTIEIKQDETIIFKLGTSNNTPNREYQVFTHPWNDVGIYSLESFEILSNPTDEQGNPAGTLTRDSCSPDGCTLTFNPNTQTKGVVRFNYRIKIEHENAATNHLYHWTPTLTATINVAPLLSVTGVSTEGDWSMDDGVFAETTVNIKKATGIGEKVGYYHLENKDVNGLRILEMSRNDLGDLFYNNNNIVSFPHQLPNSATGAWDLTLKSDAFRFGEVFVKYQVCDLANGQTNCVDENVVQSDLTDDQTKWARIFVKPSDVPPVSCTNKIVQAYAQKQRKISFARGLDPNQCQNGDWWYDADNNEAVGIDEIVAVYIKGTGKDGFIAANGDTTCSTSGEFRVCACKNHSNHSGEDQAFADLGAFNGGYAGCNIEVYYTPGVANATFDYKTVTHSAIIGQNGFDYHSASSLGSFTVQVIDPPKPVATDVTVNAEFEDQAKEFKLRKGDGAGWLDAAAPCLPEPDGCPMEVNLVNIVTFSNNDFLNVTFSGCETNNAGIYECTVGAEPYPDKNGELSFTFSVSANGKTSDPKTAKLVVPANDDPPNTYKNNVFNNGTHRYLFWRGDDQNYQPLESSFYSTLLGDSNSSGQAIPVIFKRWTGDAYDYRGSIWIVRQHGYFDVDGDLAKEIKILSVNGGSFTNNTIACDTDGVCTGEFIPDGSRIVSNIGHDWGNRATFTYQVVSTVNDATSPTTAGYIEVVGNDDPIVAQHKPYNDVTEATGFLADITPEGFEQEYVVGQDSKVRFSIVQGVDYLKQEWRSFPRTDRASHVEFKNPSNISLIKDAQTNLHCSEVSQIEENGVEIDTQTCTCQDGKCQVYFLADKARWDYRAFPLRAAIEYRLIANDGYNCKNGNCGLPTDVLTTAVTGGFDFYGRLKTASEWKKLTYKVTANGLGKYLDPPDLAEHVILTPDANKFTSRGTSVALTIGDGLELGVNADGINDDDIYYSHPSAGQDWQPLRRLHILEGSKNITVGGCAAFPCKIDCVDGICQNVTFTPATQADGSAAIWGMGAGNANDAAFQSYAIIEAEDNWGGRSDPSFWHFNQEPEISVRDVCVFDIANVASQSCFRSKLSDDDTTVSSGETLNIQIRKKQEIQSIRDYSEYEYSTADSATKATRVVLSNFNDLSLLQNDTLARTGITCTGAGAAMTCEVACDQATGHCAFPVTVKDNITDISQFTFQYQIFAGDMPSRAVWPRWAKSDVADYYGIGDARWTYHSGGKGKYEITIKPIPVIPAPNPAVNIALGSVEKIKIGIAADANNNVLNGVNYPDQIILDDKISSIEFFKITNDSGDLITRGDIIANNFNTATKVGSFDYAAPATLGNGTDKVGYRVTVWGSSAEGVIDITLANSLTSLATTINLENTGTAEQNLKTVNISPNEEYSDNDETQTLLAKKIQLKSVNINHLRLAGSASHCDEANLCNYEFACDNEGICSFQIAPATNQTLGTYSFQYRLQTDPEQGWSNLATATVDIKPVATPPTVYDMAIEGEDESKKIVVISSAPSQDVGADYGYFDINTNAQGQRELAVALKAFDARNGTLSGQDIACTNGICIAEFTPNAGFYTPENPTENHFGHFNFRVATVNTNDENWSDVATPATVKINFIPQIRSFDVATAGIRNITKTIVISEDNGFSYNPGAFHITHIVTSNATNGALTNATKACNTGNCSLDFTPAADFTGTANFAFKLEIRDNDGNVLKSSNTSTVAITINAEDQAPTAKNFSINPVNRDPIVINLKSPDHYEDRESDHATSINFPNELQASMGVISDNACVNGICSFKFTPNADYQGEVKLAYTIDAGGKTSNVAVISINLPAPADKGFSLNWGASPTLSSTCQINVPVSITEANYCDTNTCNQPVAFIDPAVANRGATADLEGFNAQLTSISGGSQFFSSYALEGGATPKRIEIGRYLSLTSDVPQSIRATSISASPSIAESMQGYQAAYSGCLGNSCNTSLRVGSVSAGNGFSCAVMSDSRVGCWGINDAGQLGNDSTTTPAQDIQYVKDPTNQPGDAWHMFGVAAVAAGKSHACSLQSNGRVYCWGDDSSGQIGNGNLDTNCANNICRIPQQVMTAIGSSPLTGVVALSLGDDHSCALRSEGSVYCWGKNSSGQLGDGSTTDRSYAQPVLKVLTKDTTDNTITGTAELDHIFKITAGGAHTCALYTPVDGVGAISAQNILCWGSNTHLQIGDGYKKDANDSLSADSSIAAEDSPRPYPVLVRDNVTDQNALGSIIDISAGSGFTCALKEILGGGVETYCWGENTNSQTGQNYDETAATASIQYPSLVDMTALPAGVEPVRIASGAKHACALLGDRSARCWGATAAATSNSILGSAGTNNGLTPSEVLNSLTNETLNDAEALSVGPTHSCVLKADGFISCWGLNDTAQLAISAATTERATAQNIDDGGTDLKAAYRTCTTLYQVSAGN